MCPIGAWKGGAFLAVSESPDPCKTPPANAPVPYNLVAKLEEALSVSPDVKYTGHPVILVDESTISQVLGDEAGTGGGVKSGCNQGEVKFIAGNPTVKANGKLVVREGDRVTMNKGNTTGVVVCMLGAEPKNSDTEEEPSQIAPKPSTAGDSQVLGER